MKPEVECRVHIGEAVVHDRMTSVSVDVNLTRNLADVYSREFVGNARRRKSDTDNADAAMSLALGRALTAAGKALTRRGNGLVKHADDTKAIKAAQARRPRKGQSTPKPEQPNEWRFEGGCTCGAQATAEGTQASMRSARDQWRLLHQQHPGWWSKVLLIKEVDG